MNTFVEKPKLGSQINNAIAALDFQRATGLIDGALLTDGMTPAAHAAWSIVIADAHAAWCDGMQADQATIDSLF